MMIKIGVAIVVSLTTARIAAAIVIEYGIANQYEMAKIEKANEDLSKGNWESALRGVNELLRSDAKFFPAYFIRAEIYMDQRKWAAAVADCDAGLKLEPHFIDLAIMRAISNRALRKYAASIAELDHVIAIHPTRLSILSWAFDQRAWLRATCPDAAFRDGQKAIADAKRACAIMKWSDANTLDTLAAAYAEAGDFDSAIKYVQQAMTFSAGKTALCRAHLASFQQHRAIRE